MRLDRPGGDPADGQGSDPEPRAFVIEESLGYLVNRAARRMATDLSDELRTEGVAIGQWAVLMFLWARDGMTQAELSRLVAIEPPTMVRTVDRMVRDGLVTREADPSDGRVSRIRLTARGAALQDALVPKAIEVNRAARARLTEQEWQVLIRALRKLAEAPSGAGAGDAQVAE